MEPKEPVQVMSHNSVKSIHEEHSEEYNSITHKIRSYIYLKFNYPESTTVEKPLKDCDVKPIKSGNNRFSGLITLSKIIGLVCVLSAVISFLKFKDIIK